MSKRLFVSNRDESVRLFKNPILEYFSHIHPSTPVIVYVPVIVLSLYFGFNTISSLSGIMMFFLGILLWTVLEYIIHRWVFHYDPKTELGKRIHFLAHGVHHDYPRDRTRLVMPLLVSVPLAFFFFYTFKLIFSEYYLFTFAGLVFGYVCYDTIHFATHHFKMNGRIGKFLKEYHLKHHYIDPNTAFGVSNPLWDYVFFTVPVRDKVKNIDE